MKLTPLQEFHAAVTANFAGVKKDFGQLADHVAALKTRLTAAGTLSRPDQAHVDQIAQETSELNGKINLLVPVQMPHEAAVVPMEEKEEAPAKHRAHGK